MTEPLKSISTINYRHFCFTEVDHRMYDSQFQHGFLSFKIAFEDYKQATMKTTYSDTIRPVELEKDELQYCLRHKS